MHAISVIICTHNPNPSFLKQTIAALQAQTLPTNEWEFVIVDNASQPAVSNDWVAWHPHGRVVQEPRLGLTYARFQAIESAAGHILLFVDDDNLLAPTYVQDVNTIGEQYPQLGVWGAGQIVAQYIGQKPAWIEQYQHWLAVASITEAQRLSTHHFDTPAMPYGAGIVIRRQFAERYVALRNRSEHQVQLGRTGQRLIGGEEADMTLIAAFAGAEFGKFRHLRLTHLIPERRTTVPYLERLMYDLAYSGIVLEKRWEQQFIGQGRLRHNRVVLHLLRWFAPLIQRGQDPHTRLYRAKISGMLDALNEES